MSNSYITRVWYNNRNNFVISDCPEKQVAAVKSMVARGGRMLESSVCTHELGEIVIIRDDTQSMSKSHEGR